jgi:toxic protein SymE
MARNDSTTPQRRSPKDKGCHTRKIKVNQIHYMRQLKNDPAGAGRSVPWIQLKGYWLNHAGFQINTPVKVRVMEGCLVLTVQD